MFYIFHFKHSGASLTDVPLLVNKSFGKLFTVRTFNRNRHLNSDVVFSFQGFGSFISDLQTPQTYLPL
jgi:hypothetical protein